ncbi:hypothetical protein [Microbacterium sp. NIBRBAC000506063]|nr:hypothetical protein [Microbacterium sp. NIBRBAC000506063]
MSWTVGLLCVVVIGGLLSLAAPLGPSVVEYIGDTLRSLDP